MERGILSGGLRNGKVELPLTATQLMEHGVGQIVSMNRETSSPSKVLDAIVDAIVNATRDRIDRGVPLDSALRYFIPTTQDVYDAARQKLFGYFLPGGE